MSIFVNMLGGEDMAYIDEDRSAERIGNRIKKIRETREMTRAELGGLVGLDQNRVQQYENGRRKPKVPLLKKFAVVLGVETMALMDPSPESYVGAMYTLFQMEEKLGMRIVKADGRYCLQFGDGVRGGLNTYLSKWYEVAQELEKAMPYLTDEERKKKVFDYNMFEWTYPTGIAKNSRRKYDEHPINRMQEIQEDDDYFRSLMEESEKPD